MKNAQATVSVGKKAKKKCRLRAKRGDTHFSPGPGEAEMEGYKFEDFIARLCLKTLNPLINR